MTKRRKPDVELSSLPLPAVHSAGPRKRIIRRSHVSDAATALGKIAPNCEIVALTNGHFSIVDIIEHMLNEVGPASIDLATWTASGVDLKRAHAFMMREQITRMRLLIDPSFKARQPEFCAALQQLFSAECIRTLPIHAKFVIIRNAAYNIVVRSSMNLNTNNRCEIAEISDDVALADFMSAVVDAAFETPSASNFTSQSKSAIDGHDIQRGLIF